MSKRRHKLEGQTIIVPLRVPADLRGKIKKVAAESRLSEADIMRLALDRGLGTVERMFQRIETAAA